MLLLASSLTKLSQRCYSQHSMLGFWKCLMIFIYNYDKELLQTFILSFLFTFNSSVILVYQNWHHTLNAILSLIMIVIDIYFCSVMYYCSNLFQCHNYTVKVNIECLPTTNIHYNVHINIFNKYYLIKLFEYLTLYVCPF